MDTETLTVRAELIDELSGGVAKMAAAVSGMAATVKGLDVASGTAAGAGLARLGAQLDRVTKLGNTLGGGISDLVGWIGGKLVDAAKRGAEALGLLGVAAVVWGTKVTVSLQQSRLAMDTFLGSVSAGDAMFKQLQSLQGPFSLEALTQGAQSLLTAGASPAQASALTTAIANIAAPQVNPNAAFDAISQAVNRIQETGRIEPRALLAFMNSGVDAYGLLAQELHIPRDQVKKQLQELMKSGGEMAVPSTFLTDLANLTGPLAKFRGGQAAQRATLGGQLTSAKIEIGETLSAIEAPVLGWVQRSVLPKVQAWTQGVTGRAPNVVPIIGRDLASGDMSGAARMIDELVGGGGRLVPILDPLLRGLQSLYKIVRTDVIPLGKDLLAVAVPALKALDGVLGFMAGHQALTVGLVASLVGIAGVRAAVGPVSQLAGAFGSLKTVIGTGGFLQGVEAFLRGLFGLPGGIGGKAAGGVGGVGGPVVLGGQAGAGGVGLLTGLAMTGGGGYEAYHGLTRKPGVGHDLETIGGSALAGAGIGSIIPGLGTLVGGILGAGLGTGLTIGHHLFGQPKSKGASAALGTVHVMQVQQMTVVAANPNDFAQQTLALQRQHMETGYQSPYGAPA